MDNMKETILRDGEIAVLVNGVEIIMNVNTAFEILAKLGAAEAKPEVKPEVQVTAVVVEAKKEAPAPKLDFDKYPIYGRMLEDGEVTDGKVSPVVVFAFDRAKVNETGNLYAGLTKRVGYFETMKDAEVACNINYGRVSPIARTWYYVLEDTWKPGRKTQYADKDDFYCYKANYAAKPWENRMGISCNTPYAFIRVCDLPKNFKEAVA